MPVALFLRLLTGQRRRSKLDDRLLLRLTVKWRLKARLTLLSTKIPIALRAGDQEEEEEGKQTPSCFFEKIPTCCARGRGLAVELGAG